MRKRQIEVPDLMTRPEAARELAITPEWLRRLELNGTIRALHTTGGKSLFLAADVAKLKRERGTKGR